MSEISRNYIIGIAVDSADELGAISPKVRAFIEELGDGTAEIQVAIGAQDQVYEEQSSAIGFLSADDVEEYDEEDE